MIGNHRQPDDAARPAVGLHPFARTFEMLDTLLVSAIEDADAAYGPQAKQDLFRGLYITPEDVGRLFRRSPGEPLFRPARENAPGAQDEHPASGEPPPARTAPRTARGPFPWLRRRASHEPPSEETPAPSPPARRQDRHDRRNQARETLGDALFDIPAFGWLSTEYGLSDFDLIILLIALAPELDLRYERLYAYLQDDVTRRRPSVDLALNLLCYTAEEKALRREHFSPGAPLIRWGLIHLASDRDDTNPPLLARFFRMDPQVVNFILGQNTLDPALAGFCRLEQVDRYFDELPLEDETRLALEAFTAWSRDTGAPLRLFFSGTEAAVKLQAAEALAASFGVPLLRVDLPLAITADRELAEVPGQAVRQARLAGAVLLLEGIDALERADDPVPLSRLLDALEECPGVVIITGSRAPTAVASQFGDMVEVGFATPEYSARRFRWEMGLADCGIFLRQEDLDALAGRFRLGSEQIDRAVAGALNRARWRDAVAYEGDPTMLEKAQPLLGDLYAAARQQTGRDLNSLAHKVDLHYTWDDIVLPAESLDQLREIFQRVAYRHRVMDEWGFDEKISLGKGVTVLFSGPSGTGKTMAAEIIANELGLDLFKIDLSGVVSKYIGETEKNLDRIFQAASQSNAILFFDEADAIFGKRSEVRDSHDRYANIEISYLLQKMEEYEGVAILSTNLRQNLDDAFLRRMAFTVHFPFPDETSRRKIWEGIWPERLPRDTLDFSFLASQYRVTGGNIKNIAIAAAFLAAEQDRPVCMEHVYHAVKREFQKLGKTMTDAELYGMNGKEVTA